MAPFDYLVVVDPQVTFGAGVLAPEVIEFSWVVFDVALLQAVDEKQIFIKPQRDQPLTPECQHETGITDAMLEGAGTLQACIQAFNDYAYRTFIGTNKDFCIVCCSEISVKYLLRLDAQSKGVKLAAHYSKYVDLGTEFRKIYPQWGAASGIHEMTERIGISLDKSIKGGLLVCRAGASILGRMCGEGAKFSSTVTIPDDYDPSQDTAMQALASRRDTYSSDRAQGAASEETRAEPAPTQYIKCRGVPFSGTERDVVQLFNGITIPPGGITMCMNHAGRFNGEAILRFASVEDAGRALERNGTQVHRRFVEVLPSGPEELESIDQAYEAVRTLDYTDVTYAGVVRMRGLPFNVCIRTVTDFLGDLSHAIKPGGVVLCEAQDGRRNGEAFVEFTKESFASEAHKKDRQSIGSRYVEIFKVRKGDMIKYLESRFADGGGFPPPRRFAGPPPITPMGSSEFLLKLRGLPFNTKEKDLVDFFARANVCPSAISLCLNAREQPTGEAIAEFATNEDMQKGTSLNKDNLGHRYVELFRVNRAEALERLGFNGMPPFPQMMAAMDPYMRPMGGPADRGNGFGGDPYGAPPSGFGGGGYGGGGYGGGVPGGGYGGGGYGVPDSYGVPPAPPPFNNGYGGEEYGAYAGGGAFPGGPGGFPGGPGGYQGGAAPGGFPPPAGMYGGAPTGGAYGGGFMGDGGHGNDRSHGDARGGFRGAGASAGGGGMGFSGITSGPSTIKVRGLPWRCTTDEIVDFFRGYALAPGDAIQMGVAPDGRFTGEAWVTFAGPTEAQRAQTDRNRAHMGSRYVELFAT